ncbi:MAG TPA: hypothetical protein VMH02_02445 [Verrucomicrobiae bacterium]|nr:hypothetical protein [Verrucomicrobiae bacterium]
MPIHLPHDPRAIASGAAGGLWLLGLWFAAPLLGRTRSASLRVAAMMALGSLVPLALGAIDALYGWSSWAVVAALVLVRCLRHRGVRQEQAAEAPAWDLAVGLGVLLALAWPLAVRPAMDGDTLIYHLPNAASWAAQHGIWATGTRYWWYPPASELFASGLLAAAGIGAAAFAGLVPAVLLILTLRAAAVRHEMPPVAGTLAACALLATPVAAVQLVSLQNDLWLSALFLCTLVELEAPAFAVLALTKPQGLLYAIVAGATWVKDRGRLVRASAFALGALALWAARDLLLAPHAAIPIGSTAIPAMAESTIAAHLPHSLAVLAVASWHAGIAWSVLLALGAAAIVFSRELYLRWAALAALVLFAFVPTAYEGGTIAQLATGASLRFALPVAALGALWALTLGRRAAPFVGVLAGFAVLAGIAAQWRLFASDATTHDTPLIAAGASLLLAIAIALRDRRVCAALAATLCVALAALAGGLSRSHPGGYVTDTYGGAFVYAASARAARVVTLGLPAGAAVTVDPAVEAFDGLDDGTCAQARALRAVIVASAQRAADLHCGRVVYRDARTAVIRP